ncbi:Uncharacterized protein PECH_000457 [Penicillium ucsense]|uniref:Uncharacterized protein n=1 Tax=Penicillium ucsense TaxID=2839758 RepID=A0A8J8WIY9_9EURO|nr:Uncharacterized protein PECM_006713 [Penicillium ucsense]KAF7733554.1 Uncharacterized protein PECH_000457 [Penicillium ucsense]
MSVKRKASLSGPAPSTAWSTPSSWGPSNGSAELPSRTRKRFRNGRPDDEVVYEKTLRWIYSAQQQQPLTTPMDIADDAMTDAEQGTTPEAVDPRQQSLLRFFQPRSEQSSSFRPSPEALAARANETAVHRDDLLRHQAFSQLHASESTSGSETLSPGFLNTDTDMEMEMEVDGEQNNDSSNPVSKWAFWNGGV